MDVVEISEWSLNLHSWRKEFVFFTSHILAVTNFVAIKIVSIIPSYFFRCKIHVVVCKMSVIFPSASA